VRFVGWLTLVLFGGVSLLGQGLHLLSNCDCLSGHGRVAATAEATVGQAGGHFCRYGHWHAAGGSAVRSAEAVANDQPGFRGCGGYGEDCFICRFFAQAQHLRCEAPLLSCRFARPHRFWLAVEQPWPAPIEPYQARGPPAQV
jgi:hypothetical protein